MFIYNDLTNIEWEHEILSLYIGDVPKGIKKHCIISTKQPKKCYKIANFKLCDKITKIDWQTSMKVLHTLYEREF